MYYLELNHAEINSLQEKARLKYLEHVYSFRDSELCGNKIDNFAGVDPNKIGSFMLHIIQHEIEKNSLPRQTLEKTMLVHNQEAVFDMFGTRIHIGTTEFSARIMLTAREHISSGSLDRLMNGLITHILVRENDRFFTILNANHVENISCTKIGRSMGLEELGGLVSSRLDFLYYSNLTPTNFLINPNLLHHIDRAVTHINGLNVIQNFGIPENVAYILATPSQTGKLAVRHDLQMVTSNDMGTLNTAYTLWEDIGIGIINPHSVIKINFN